MQTKFHINNIHEIVHRSIDHWKKIKLTFELAQYVAE